MIAIKYIDSPIYKNLFYKIVGVIQLFVSEGSQFGNWLFRIVKKLITTAISTIKIWCFFDD